LYTLLFLFDHANGPEARLIMMSASSSRFFMSHSREDANLRSDDEG
jgi:hypothetical protein